MGSANGLDILFHLSMLSLLLLIKCIRHLIAILHWLKWEAKTSWILEVAKRQEVVLEGIDALKFRACLYVLIYIHLILHMVHFLLIKSQHLFHFTLLFMFVFLLLILLPFILVLCQWLIPCCQIFNSRSHTLHLLFFSCNLLLLLLLCNQYLSFLLM